MIDAISCFDMMTTIFISAVGFFIAAMGLSLIIDAWESGDFNGRD